MQVADQSILSASISNANNEVMDTWNQSRSDDQLKSFMLGHSVDFSEIEQEIA